MFLNFSTITMKSFISRPLWLASHSKTYHISQISKIITKIKTLHMLSIFILLLIILINAASKRNLKVSPSIVIHKEQNSDNCTKQTSNIRNNRIKLGKSSVKYVSIRRFTKDKTSEPIARHFLNRNGCRQHHNSAPLKHCISIGKNTMISIDLIIRNEYIIRRS